MKYDIWVDFNDLDMVQAGGLHSLMKYASNPEKIRVDRRVIVGDSDGNTCEALVTHVDAETGLVTLFAHVDTFKESS